MPAPGAERADDRDREREIARTLALVGAAHAVDAPDRLRIDADSGPEREAAAVHATHGDAPRPPGLDRHCEPARSVGRVRRHAERTRKNARPSTRQEADRHVAHEPVECLVEPSVAGEDDDRLGTAVDRCGDELRRVARTLGELDGQLDDTLELGLHGRELRLRDSRGERIDDQRDGSQGHQ